MKIIFLGQNPSKLAPHSAFTGTRSGSTLLKWINLAGLDLSICTFYNTFDQVGISISQKQISDKGKSAELMQKLCDVDLVFACGDVAYRASDLCNRFYKLNLEIVKLPHPSGLNRRLNDDSFVKETIKKIKGAYEDRVRKKMEEV